MAKSIPLGPPPSTGIKPIAVAVKSKNGKWVWKSVKQSKEDGRLRKKWQTKIKKADKKGKWWFKWPK